MKGGEIGSVEDGLMEVGEERWKVGFVDDLGEGFVLDVASFVAEELLDARGSVDNLMNQTTEGA
jgi:hypothetical protein